VNRRLTNIEIAKKTDGYLAPSRKAAKNNSSNFHHRGR